MFGSFDLIENRPTTFEDAADTQSGLIEKSLGLITVPLTATMGVGAIARSNVYRPGLFITEPGTSGNNVDTPHRSGFDMGISTSVVVIAYIAADDWAPAAEESVVSIWGASAINGMFRCTIGATGILRFSVSVGGTGGTAQTTTVLKTLAGLANGDGCWVWWMWQSNDGTTDFKYSLDPKDTDLGSVTWTNVQINRASSVTGTLTTSTAPLQVGGYDTSGGSFPYAGKVWRAWVGTGPSTGIFSVAGATELADMDPRYWTGASTFVSGANLDVWTIHGTAAIGYPAGVNVALTALMSGASVSTGQITPAMLATALQGVGAASLATAANNAALAATLAAANSSTGQILRTIPLVGIGAAATAATGLGTLVVPLTGIAAVAAIQSANVSPGPAATTAMALVAATVAAVSPGPAAATFLAAAISIQAGIVRSLSGTAIQAGGAAELATGTYQRALLATQGIAAAETGIIVRSVPLSALQGAAVAMLATFLGSNDVALVATMGMAAGLIGQIVQGVSITGLAAVGVSDQGLFTRSINVSGLAASAISVQGLMARSQALGATMAGAASPQSTMTKTVPLSAPLSGALGPTGTVQLTLPLTGRMSMAAAARADLLLNTILSGILSGAAAVLYSPGTAVITVTTITGELLTMVITERRITFRVTNPRDTMAGQYERTTSGLTVPRTTLGPIERTLE